MQIFIKMLKGYHITLDLDEKKEYTIETIKKMINKKDPIVLDKVYLSYQSKKLLENKKISDYGITKDATLELNINWITKTSVEEP